MKEEKKIFVEINRKISNIKEEECCTIFIILFNKMKEQI